LLLLKERVATAELHQMSFLSGLTQCQTAFGEAISSIQVQEMREILNENLTQVAC